ncbi:helix-turn-helix domain-containing protein [Nisaea acidiphila]|uniref:Helix-turn-helix domain-containing protein n=1 Tax=Nisaea acidiphila TaxID=1862145 RepID=A0A9J7B0J2_9PROT|nr:helix-turn-helix domain-containing protein [Nisaea acidiphila]UUX51996.1 helix-turn-helix domain-containing protein [Nisaea acidiphila]
MQQHVSGETSVAAMHSPCDDCDIRDLAICGTLRVDEVQRLSRIMTSVELAAGDTIVDEGEPSDFVYTLTSGAVRLYKLLADGRRSVTGFLFPGDFLGVSMQDIYGSSAEAITPVTLCRFQRTELEALMMDIPTLERRLFARATEEIQLMQEQIVLLGRKTAAERVASFLRSLAQRQEKRHLPANPVTVPMTRTDIADYLGLTTETVSRTITQFKTKELISIENGSRIRILDEDQLDDLAEAI